MSKLLFSHVSSFCVFLFFIKLFSNISWQAENSYILFNYEYLCMNLIILYVSNY